MMTQLCYVVATLRLQFMYMYHVSVHVLCQHVYVYMYHVSIYTSTCLCA